MKNVLEKSSILRVFRTVYNNWIERVVKEVRMDNIRLKMKENDNVDKRTSKIFFLPYQLTHSRVLIFFIIFLFIFLIKKKI